MSDEKDWIDELYAEGAKDTPPPELDAEIRAAARQPLRHPWYRNPGRLAVLATAASLVIGVSVIFFEPEPTRVAAPGVDVPDAELLDEAAADRPAPSAEIAFELEEAMPGRLAAEAKVAEEKELAARSLRTEPAPAPAVTGEPSERAFKTESTLRRSNISQQAAEVDAAAGTRAKAVATDSALGSEVREGEITEAASELEQMCGALPGTADSREIFRDEAGWLVTVTLGADVRIWRCIDGAWIEETSEQQ